MDIEIMDSFSAHADRNEMIDFISNQKKLQNLFLVHGEYESQEKFKQLLNSKGYENVRIPTLGQQFEFHE